MDKNEIGSDTKRVVHLGRPTTVSLVRVILKIETLLMSSLYLYKVILLFNCTYRKDEPRIRISSKQQRRSLVYVHHQH